MLMTTQISPQKQVYEPASQFDFNPMELLSIFEPTQQISMVARPEQVRISRYLHQVSHQLYAGYRLTLQQNQITPERIDGEIHLPDAIGKDAFLADISQVAAVYADLMDCPAVGIRLEVLKHAMCPKFHIDRTGIRLLCTYLGPGTEWLDETFANRNVLAGTLATKAALEQALVLHPQGIRQAPAQALVLLKGSLWQGNQHAGAIHRSPQIPENATRVLLALDAIW